MNKIFTLVKSAQLLELHMTALLNEENMNVEIASWPMLIANIEKLI
jgi:hypothetical protein